MGAIVVWTSGYPGTVDDTVLNFPTLTDNVDDVIASHQNSVAGAVIFLERENTGYKDNVVMTGSATEFEDQRNVERVVGSGLFDGAALAHLNVHLRMLGVFNNQAAAGNARIRLYDMGLPGTPLLPPELRSEASISDADGGVLFQAQNLLSLSASPGINADQIHNSLRLYEFRVILDSPTVGDTMQVNWAGFALGVTQ